MVCNVGIIFSQYGHHVAQNSKIAGLSRCAGSNRIVFPSAPFPSHATARSCAKETVVTKHSNKPIHRRMAFSSDINQNGRIRGLKPYAMSEHFATIRWQRGDHPFAKGRYSRKHEWHFDGGVVVPGSS